MFSSPTVQSLHYITSGKAYNVKYTQVEMYFIIQSMVARLSRNNIATSESMAMRKKETANRT